MSASDDSSSESSFDGPSRAFWAVELVPGKEYTTVLPFDLHITQAVLPATAKDAGRSVVNLTFQDEPEKGFALTSLKLDHNESQTLDVALDSDSEIKLTVFGKNSVHLSGYYVPDEPEGGMYDGYGSDEDEFDEEGEEEESDEEAVDSQIQALVEQQKRKALAQNGGNAKKAKVDAPAQKQVKAETPAQKPKTETPNKPQQQQPKQQQQQKSPAQQTKDFPNGLQITTLQAGSGAEAVKGKTVGVKYVGRLTKNGKVFDASKKPFNFKLGRGEVIAGWDQGVAGMRVGEKRKLVIPPQLGYGAAGAPPDIPPNSSLTFEVELLKVN